GTGDGRRHRPRVAARQTGADVQRREVDVGKIAHRQLAVGEDAEHRDAEHDQTGRDRTPDEQRRDVHSASVAWRARPRRSLAANFRQENDQCHAVKTPADTRVHLFIALSHLVHRRVICPQSHSQMPALIEEEGSMRVLMIVVACIACGAAPSLAQPSDRGYVNFGGGVAISSDTTSGNILGEAGVRVARNLFVFGDLGQFHNLQPSLVQPTVDATTLALASDGVTVTGTGRVPALQVLGGVRYLIPTHGGATPYVLGAAGAGALAADGGVHVHERDAHRRDAHAGRRRDGATHPERRVHGAAGHQRVHVHLRRRRASPDRAARRCRRRLSPLAHQRRHAGERAEHHGGGGGPRLTGGGAGPRGAQGVWGVDGPVGWEGKDRSVLPYPAHGPTLQHSLRRRAPCAKVPSNRVDALEESEDVLAEDVLHLLLAVAFREQRGGDLRQLRDI